MLSGAAYLCDIGFNLLDAARLAVEELAVPALETAHVPRRGRDRLTQRPKELVADKTYDRKDFRDWLRSRKIKPTILPYERRAGKSAQAGTPRESRSRIFRALQD